MGTGAFEVEGVTKTYTLWRHLRRIPVRGVTDLTLSVPRGVIFGLLGLNGAGKTTTMKLLVGLMRPDRGQVRVLGESIEQPAVRARVGFLPEFPYLPLQLRAAELLGHYGRMSGLAGSGLAARVARTLERVGLEPGRADPLRAYSKGQLQRVAMAQALLHEPEVICADEQM